MYGANACLYALIEDGFDISAQPIYPKIVPLYSKRDIGICQAFPLHCS